jgi:hypothetical protein
MTVLVQSASRTAILGHFTVFFVLFLFVFVRQLCANLLGVSRDFLTAMLVAVLALLGLLSFEARLRERRRDFILVDVLSITQFYLVGVAIYFYLAAGKIHGNHAIYAVYYYMFAPLLVYSGFLLQRLGALPRRSALMALGCVYVVTFWAALYESLGIEFWLFRYDRWVLQKNFLGIARASGMYGTHIDYGLLSFFTFVTALYCHLRRRHWFSTGMMGVATVGLLLTMSRAWIGAWFIVVVLHLTRSQPLARRLKTLALVLIAGTGLYVAADRMGFVDMLRSVDEYTQISNESRLGFLENMPKWLDEFALIGVGPGTQNGQPIGQQKFIGDFLWLAILVEYGTILGSVLILLKITLLLYVLWRAWMHPSGGVLKPVVIAGCLSFLLASLVNSAYAHFVTVSAFYVAIGLFLSSIPAKPPVEAA